ncbi:MAG TPA: SurA N-terminal domain-containing protein [Sphingomonas sp.]|nr:SurA N-terminal domain-containing protein [Sphingomonas sp.]
MSKRVAISTMCAMAALVAGCHRGAPEGQVAAKVNGDEVTLQELNTELQAANVPEGMDKKLAQREALQQIVDRKLLLEAAREKKIDKSPEFQSQKLRTDEILLAQAYARQQMSAVPVPNDSDIIKFMTDRPNAFAKREQLQLDQIRFRTPKDIQQIRKLQGDHSLDAVAAHLTSLGIKFERGPNALDTAQVPTEMVNKINELAAGEPFVLPGNGFITVNVIIGRRAIANDPVQARQAAVGAWRQQRFQSLIADQLKTLKSTAKITYQAGFEPLPKKGNVPAPAGK